MANNKEKLFSEFPPVSTEQWLEKVTEDLKGGDFEKKLVWKTNEGFKVQPFYRASDIEGLKSTDALPGEFPYLRGNKKSDNAWLVRQSIVVTDFKEANAKAVKLTEKGVDSFCFRIKGKDVNKENILTLINGINPEAIEINFCTCQKKSLALAEIVMAEYAAKNYDAEKVQGSINFDAINSILSKGKEVENWKETAKALVETCAAFPKIRPITVNALSLNNAGSYIFQELGYALAWGNEYMNTLTEMGISADAAAKAIKFNFGISSNYFMEIAKFRAARMLWANVVDAYGTDSECAKKMELRATTSEWNQTVYDAYVNMLRVTTEAMSASIAGVDYLEVLPFDYSFRTPNEFSNRIARNVQSILKGESHFDKVVDPSAGSYYIETLTNSIANSAWALFRSVEEAGGYVAKFKEGFIQSEIKAVADKKDKNLAMRKDILLGSNQYPNFLEKAEDCITTDIVSRDVLTYNGIKFETPACTCEQVAEPLKPYRGSQVFEAMRLATDRSEKQPMAFMLTFGNLAMCRARAQFSCNFFATAGIKVVDNNRFSSVEEGVKAALEAGADIVVACSSDEEYAEAVPQIAELIGDKAIVVVAGAPACQAELEEKGIKNFINVKSNVLETLKDYQAKLGIKAL